MLGTGLLDSMVVEGASVLLVVMTSPHVSATQVDPDEPSLTARVFADHF